MNCPKCNAPNPEGKKFCGDCGAPLDPALGSLREALELRLRQQLQEAIEEKWTEQSLAEGEAGRALVARLSAWAKMAGFFVGVPVAVLTLVVGFLIIQTYLTFTARIDNTQQEVARQLQQAQREQQRLQVTPAMPATPGASSQAEAPVVSVRDEVEAVLNQHFKDQKVVEMETAEAIVTKLSEWAKLLGFFVGIPVALLAVVLGFFGVKSFADLSGLINSVDMTSGVKS
jgi:hypothetical protein